MFIILTVYQWFRIGPRLEKKLCKIAEVSKSCKINFVRICTQPGCSCHIKEDIFISEWTTSMIYEYNQAKLQQCKKCQRKN